MSDFIILDDEKIAGSEKKTFKVKLTFIEEINNFIASLQKIKVKEKIIFYRLLGTMTNSGMTLLKSMIVLEKQEKNLVFKNVLGRFCEDLRSGTTLSDSMSHFLGDFSEAEVGIIQSGEKTGQLNLVLIDLAVQIEKVHSLNGKIKGAMIYPFFILLVVMGVVVVMMTTIVPKLLEIFDDKSLLPASTQFLIVVSDVLNNYWFFLILLAIAFGVMAHIWKKTPDGKYIFDKIMLKIPIFGGINKKSALSRFSRIFSGLIGSGVSVVESLRITSSAVGNEVYKQRILLLIEDVSIGIKMWESLDGDVLFPEMMIQMIQVGEQTAKLDVTILKVADFYDEDIDNTVSVLNKLLEPFIIVVLALVVGFIALAIMQPIMNLSDIVSLG